MFLYEVVKERWNCTYALSIFLFVFLLFFTYAWLGIASPLCTSTLGVADTSLSVPSRDDNADIYISTGHHLHLRRSIAEYGPFDVLHRARIEVLSYAKWLIFDNIFTCFSYIYRRDNELNPDLTVVDREFSFIRRLANMYKSALP